MNSSIEITEAVKLAKKLIDRTREGKLRWEADEIHMAAIPDLSGATAFKTTLEGNLEATVSIVKPEQDTQLAFSLVELVPGWTPLSQVERNREVLSVSIEKDPSFGYDTPDEMRLNGLLIDLYALARRSALKIDGSIEKALTYLDRIAG